MRKIFILLISFIASTWNIKIIGNVPNKPAIIAFWHGLMLPVWKYFSLFEPTAIVSPSKDGELLAQLLKKWNYKLIRGSSDKKSKETMNRLVDLAKNELVLITPDGPRGPTHKFKAGAVVSAMRANVALCLCTVQIKWKIIIRKSWDNFTFPLPFSTITLKISSPIFISQDTSRIEIDNLIKKAENLLNNNQL